MENAAAAIGSDRALKTLQRPSGMVKILGGDYIFKVRGIEIEGFDEYRRRCAISVGSIGAECFHEHRMQIKPFVNSSIP